jgi:alkylation response protein AidB-like acyl-CoA dehydrogenase
MFSHLSPTTEISEPVQLVESADESEFRSRARSWLAAHAELAPKVELAPGDRENLSAWRAWSARLHQAGFAGLTWPADCGGGGLAPGYQAIWAEEVAAAGVPDHIGIVGIGMAGPTIIEHGTSEQRERFLRPTLAGEIVWCQGFSEPDSGSDLASVRTSARFSDGRWVINGQKVWSSWAHMADWCILLARTEGQDRPRHHGLSFFLVDMRAPGVQVRPLKQITGDAEFNEMFEGVTCGRLRPPKYT